VRPRPARTPLPAALFVAISVLVSLSGLALWGAFSTLVLGSVQEHRAQHGVLGLEILRQDVRLVGYGCRDGHRIHHLSPPRSRQQPPGISPLGNARLQEKGNMCSQIVHSAPDVVPRAVH